MKLSKRLNEIAMCVTPGNVLADIGTDHGHIPIFLVENEVIPKAYAMDINKGPLNKAKENVEKSNLGDKIILRQSDGLKMLNKNEADTILIAGMGGELVIRILTDGIDKVNTAKELVLSPHSEIEKVRKYVLQKSYDIIDEHMIVDDGKYYVIIKCNIDVCKDDNLEKTYSEEELVFGRKLLESQDKVLLEYLINKKKKNEEIRKSIENSVSHSTASRHSELIHEMDIIDKALNYYN